MAAPSLLGHSKQVKVELPYGICLALEKAVLVLRRPKKLMMTEALADYFRKHKITIPVEKHPRELSPLSTAALMEKAMRGEP